MNSTIVFPPSIEFEDCDDESFIVTTRFLIQGAVTIEYKFSFDFPDVSLAKWKNLLAAVNEKRSGEIAISNSNGYSGIWFDPDDYCSLFFSNSHMSHGTCGEFALKDVTGNNNSLPMIQKYVSDMVNILTTLESKIK